MTVRMEGEATIVLEGQCPIEDAAALIELLCLAHTTDGTVSVDWHECDYAHTAVVQILLATRPPMHGPPRAAVLRKWIEPMLAGSGH